jgi:hypothetical protein
MQDKLRHSKLEMTGWHMREIPDSVRNAVAETDAEIIADSGGAKFPILSGALGLNGD